MSGRRLMGNNKGASLVLILVAMLFVGIIGGIVLTITVGNSKSTKTTIEDSEAFYSSESVLDDFKMYIKKVATSAATQAFEETIENSTLTDDNFSYNFKKQFYYVMQDNIKTASALDLSQSKYIEKVGESYEIDSDFVKNQISYGRGNSISIKIEDIEWNYDPTKTDDVNMENKNPVKLKNVQVSFIDEYGYANKVTADVTLRVNMPKTEWEDTSGEFHEDIDHFVMMAGGDIKPETAMNMKGSIVGSIYSYGNLNIRTKSPKDSGYSSDIDPVRITSDRIIVGGDINVDGILNISPLNDTEIALVRSKPDDSGARNVGTELWCENIKVLGSDSNMTVNKIADLSTELYLRKNLELNGKTSSFTASADILYGYSGDSADSYYDKTKAESENGEEKPFDLASSAIILNGLGAKLNLANVSDLQLAGTAFSVLPEISGIDILYDYYNNGGNMTPYLSKLAYYSQGESITYRALQALYLIPGEFIKGVGHNPMKKSEFDSLTAGSIDMDSAKEYVDDLLGDPIYKHHEVQYLDGTDSYVYLFWNFKSTADATKYFNNLLLSDKYMSFAVKQLDILGLNEGEIILPDDSDIKAKGNAISYSSSTFSSVPLDHTLNIGTNYLEKYFGMLFELNHSKSITNAGTITEEEKDSSKLFYTIFGGKTKVNSTNFLPAKSYFGKLGFGPLTSYKLNGAQVTYEDKSTSKKLGDMNYYLVTGKNVRISSTYTGDVYNVVTDANDKTWVEVRKPGAKETYIVITPGDVDIAYTGSFRGMILAGGDITIMGDLDMECLGMVSRIPSNTGKLENPSEFQALLSVITGVKEDNPMVPLNANNRLEAIFNVFNNSGSAGSTGKEFVSVEIDEFKEN